MNNLKSFLLVVVTLLYSVRVSAQFNVNGIMYSINTEDRTAEVTYTSDKEFYSGHVVIPSFVTITEIEAPWEHINGTYTVTKIGLGAFSYQALTSVTIPSSVTRIEDSAFSFCENLNSVYIPSSVKSIGQSAFSGCVSLTSIEIPESVTVIENAAFSESGLTSIRIPEGVEMISESCFNSCENLAIVVLPNSLKVIDRWAFNECPNLKSFTIPKNVKSINANAFYQSHNLVDVYSYIPASKLSSIAGTAFTNYADATLHVPYGAKSTYEVTGGWWNFGKIVEMQPVEPYSLTVSSVGCASLYLGDAVEIPESVKVYVASAVDEGKLMMSNVTGILPANTGAIVIAPIGTYSFKYTDENATPINENLFKGTTENTWITPAKGFMPYVLSSVEGEVGMYRAILTDGKFLNNANKVYMELPELGLNDEELDTSTGQLSNGFRFVFPDATGVETVLVNVPETTIYYDMQGRRVMFPTKGVYILNGKKVYVK